VSQFRERDVVARGVCRNSSGKLVATLGVQGVVEGLLADGSLLVLWDGETIVRREHTRGVVFLSRPPSAVTIEPARQVPIGMHISIANVRSLRAMLEDLVPLHTTVDRAVLDILSPALLARALFETDEALLQFVYLVSDALDGDELRDDEACRMRVARGMQIAWDRNEFGFRASYEKLIARLLEQLRRST
jgi:hypothetical protein